jgi:hypothetical protein
LIPSFPIVEYFNVPEDVLAGLLPCFVPFVIEQFAFNGTEKGFRTGVIVTISFAAHTAYHPVFVEQILVFLTAVLYTSIGVMDKPSGRFVPFHCILKGPFA